MPEWTIRLIENAEEMTAVEAIQRITWQGSETDVIPAHMLLAVVHNGGLALGAYIPVEKQKSVLVGMVFGFPGFYETPDGPRLKHHSHILAVQPEWRGKGIAFALKRAQWQMVRQQEIDRVTWTYDPLLSRNAHLNITHLGAVCNTYRRSEYGEMRDGMNAGLPSDRFHVDWWVNSKRVEIRLSRRARPKLSIEHVSESGVLWIEAKHTGTRCYPPTQIPVLNGSLVLVEIPDDFLTLKEGDLALAREWRSYSRNIFEAAFGAGYIVTDFIHERGRSYYVLTHGDSTF